MCMIEVSCLDFSSNLDDIVSSEKLVFLEAVSMIAGSPNAVEFFQLHRIFPITVYDQSPVVPCLNARFPEVSRKVPAFDWGNAGGPHSRSGSLGTGRAL